MSTNLEGLPAPLVPPDCDLRGMEYVPLYGERLLQSDFNARATDEEWRAAVILLWRAWQQIPAASLPDDDVVLARLAEYGKDVKAWQRVKAAALHAFTPCSDGRFYHRELAPLAVEVWAKRLKERERKAKWRAEQERREAIEGQGDVPVPETGTERGQDADGDVPGRVPSHAKGKHREGKRSEGEHSTASAPFFWPPRDDADARFRAYHDAGYAVLSAMGVADHPGWHERYGRVEQWLDDGADLERDILPTIERLVKREGKPPATLSYFDGAIKDAMRERGAA